MRVLRRDTFAALRPLPEGLHFTPAMSARALLLGKHRLVELDMPYQEREGRSKLHVLKDGLRFLTAILRAALLFRPGVLLNLGACLALGLASALMLVPLGHYLSTRALEEWMIYRFIIAHLLGSVALLGFCGGHLATRMAQLTLATRPPSGLLQRFLRRRAFWLVPAGLSAAGLLLVANSLAERALTGATTEHWSRFVVASFLFGSAALVAATRGLDYILDLIAAELQHL
jgi:hypothetical protein